MGEKSLNIYRQSSGYNAEDGDVIDYNISAPLTFEKGSKCTSFVFSIDGGLTSATSSARKHGLELQVCSNGKWIGIWRSGNIQLPKKSTQNYPIQFSGDIDYEDQEFLGTYGIAEEPNNSNSQFGVRLKQEWNEDGNNFALRGTTGSGTLTIYYSDPPPPPTVTIPAISSIDQNNDGTYTINWSACTGTNGSGSITYGVYDNTAGTCLSSSILGTSYTGKIPAYETARQYSVIAYYSGISSEPSSIVSKTFIKPSITAPSDLKITSTIGQTCALSWTAASLSKTTGTITYSIRRNNSEVATTMSTTYTIPETITAGWGTDASTMTVVAIGSLLSNTASGSSLTSTTSNGVSYTYKAIVKTHPSNLRINGLISYTGQTAPLSWSKAVFSGEQTPTYSIRINDKELTTTTNTSYTIAESTTKSYTGAVTITVVASGGGATSNLTNSVTYTYQPVFTKGPGEVKVNNAIGPTVTVSWSEATISNGAKITYEIYNNSTCLVSGLTYISYTFPESVTKNWEGTRLLSVKAISSGIESWSSNSASYQYMPTFNAPSNLTINNTNTYTGNAPVLKWTNATISNNATIKHYVYIGEKQLIEVQNSPYTIAESAIKSLQGEQKIKIGAIAGNLGPIYSNEVTFTYSSKLTSPSNLLINNTTSYTGQIAKLTWNLATLSSGNKITYCIYKNNQLIKELDSVNTYTFDESITSTWGLNQVSLQVSAKGDGKESTKTNLVNYTYRPVFTTPIKNLKIQGGASYQGQTVELAWDAASISNNSIIEYFIYKNDELIGTTQNTFYSIGENITKEWQNTNLLKVIANSSGITSTSNNVEYTYLANFTMPTNLTINNNNSYVGHSINLNWNASTLSNQKPISYSIRKNGQEIATTEQTSYSFNEEIISSWKEKEVIIFSIVAKGDNRTVNCANEVSFIYKPSYKTIKFYHKDLGWKECIVFRHDGVRWIKCDPYYYYLNSWQLSDHWKSP